MRSKKGRCSTTITTMTRMDTATKSARYCVGWMKSSESASAVARSVMNVAAMMTLPISVFVRPVSTRTAYTTASEVVESATPAISACRKSQPAT